MKLSDKGEFGLVNGIATLFNNSLHKDFLGVGDDASLLPWDNEKYF